MNARRILAPHIALIDFQLVGAEARLQEVQRLLGLKAPTPPDKVLVVGMYGMGGVGKTTLATKVRDEAPALFGGRIVRLCVGHGCNPRRGLEAKRRNLLQLLSPGPQRQDLDQDQERRNLRRALSNGGPLLLILDDLWTREQLLWLLGHDGSGDIVAAVANMASGSRLFLTSRDQNVLTMEWDGFNLFELKSLDGKDPELLLCLEAQRKPSDFQADQLRQALQICGGLPLALQVFGRQLRDVPPGQWQVPVLFQQRLEQPACSYIRCYIHWKSRSTGCTLSVGDVGVQAMVRVLVFAELHVLDGLPRTYLTVHGVSMHTIGHF